MWKRHEVDGPSDLPFLGFLVYPFEDKVFFADTQVSGSQFGKSPPLVGNHTSPGQGPPDRKGVTERSGGEKEMGSGQKSRHLCVRNKWIVYIANIKL